MYKRVSVVVFIILGVVAFAYAEAAEESSSKIEYDFWRCTSPTNGFWGLNEKLEPSGFEFGFDLTTVYQVNTHGGASTHNHKGRWTSRYDLEMSVDLKKLGFQDGMIFMHGWGGWPDEEGIDALSVGSEFGVNAITVGNRSFDIVELFYEGHLFSDSLTFAVGKMDFTGIFDTSAYANDECCQFLNGSLVNNPAIPFPEQGLGIVLNWDITDWLYLKGGVADAQADSRETGFKTTFCDEDYFFYVLETGITHEDDTYRFGMWIDGQDKEKLNDSTQSVHDDTGFYISLDKMLYKESSEPNDSQGLGGFFRYGWANCQLNAITNFFSLGVQYQGLFDGRDDDIFGIGYSRGTFSNYDAADYPEDYESVVEIYYNAQITPWFHLSPNVQYIANTGGSGTTKDATVFGLRAQVTF
jgi:porin